MELEVKTPNADPLGFRDAVVIHHRSTTGDGRNRLVTLAEFWDDRVRLRWVKAPAPPNDLGEAVRDVTLAVLTMADAFGTVYSSLPGSGGGSPRKLEGEVRFQPFPAAGVDEVHVTFPDGDHVIIPIPAGLRRRTE